MDGIADMGGTEGWGPVHPPPPDEKTFHEPWEGRAFALTLLTRLTTGHNLDAFRHAVERLDRDAYLDEDGYYAKWLNAAELMLTETAMLAPGAIDARARNLRGEHVEEPPVPEHPRRIDYQPTAEGSLRTVDVAPRFTVGDEVRARNISPAGHTRLPRYIRGHVGVIEIVQPAALLPDTHAHSLGENPQHLYSVRFDSHELWGSGPDVKTFAVTIELFDSYLEPLHTTEAAS